MKKLIIINQAQFGYHIDSYYHSKYLRENFNTIYICCDHGFPKIEMNGVQVIYISKKGDRLAQWSRFLKRALKEITDEVAIVFTNYFNWISLPLRLFRPRHCFVLDIRTGSINQAKRKRIIYNFRIRIESIFFNNITVISESLAKKLKLSHKAHILPLGANIISHTNKKFDKIHLLYVGTFYSRNIEVTVRGFKAFYDEFGKYLSVTYTIIGDGPAKEKENIEALIGSYGLSDIIAVKGRIPHTKLKPYFDAANIGVSYIPLTEYYDVQPATKTFEYLLSGMPVIATRTYENQKVITPENGVLIGDRANDFYYGLKTILKNRHHFDSEIIRRSSMPFTWENIIVNNLKPYLANLK